MNEQLLKDFRTLRTAIIDWITTAKFNVIYLRIEMNLVSCLVVDVTQLIEKYSEPVSEDGRVSRQHSVNKNLDEISGIA